MEVLNRILLAQSEHRPLFALLLDPDKQPDFQSLRLTDTEPDLIFVGGSTARSSERLITLLRQQTTAPLVLFPGSFSQFDAGVDAILFLSVLSGRNAEMLIGRQVAAARAIRQSGVESVPMGYILIDGGRLSSVEQASHTQAISQQDVQQIVDTAIAAELLGKQLIYLEAGSGALNPVNEHIIRAVRQATHVPLIVGGGIRDIPSMQRAYRAGADIVVVGNHFEQHPDELTNFIRAIR